MSIFREFGISGCNNDDNKQHEITCPFCGREKKFSFKEKDNIWKCWVCDDIGGGQRDFIMKFRDRNFNDSQWDYQIEELAQNRGLKPQTLKHFGVFYNEFSDEFLLPHNNDVVCVKRFHPNRQLAPQAKMVVCKWSKIEAMYNSADYDWDNIETVYICEGEWDTMTAWEVFDSPTVAVIGTASGGGGIKTITKEMITNKEVIICMDSDMSGEQHNKAIIQHITPLSPKQVKKIKWEQGTPNTYDLRDIYKDCELNPTKFKHWISSHLKGVAIKNTKKVSYEQLVASIRQWLYLPDDKVLKFILGIYCANRISGDPVWGMLVAKSGGAKSELLSLLNHETIEQVTTLTPAALISGKLTKKEEDDPSLLARIHNRVMVVQDFTTMLAMNPQQLTEIFGILREAYGGHVKKAFGNFSKEFDCKFGFIAGTTQIIDKYTSEMSSLGERFIRFYLDYGDKERDVIRRAVMENDIAPELRAKTKAIMHNYINSIDWNFKDFGTKEHEETFVVIADMLSKFRTSVFRNKYRQDQVEFQNISEIGTRYAKQSVQFAQGLATALQTKMNGEFVDLLIDILLGSIPFQRACFFKFALKIVKEKWGEFSILDFHRAYYEVPYKMLNEMFDDLQQFGIIEVVSMEDNMNSMYKLKRRWIKDFEFLISKLEEK